MGIREEREQLEDVARLEGALNWGWTPEVHFGDLVKMMVEHNLAWEYTQPVR